ncbi:MAG: AAA family ATPase [Actinomycetota bacterium]|nr:AAA family ATPase [Actinomycetota bacterium]
MALSGPLPKPALIPVGALVVLVGAPAAGKSTFAARLVEAGVVDAHDVLSADALRQEITGDASDTSRDRKVFARIRGEVDDRLRAGRTTVVDATGLWPRRRARHLTVARDHGRPTVAVRFPTPITELLARNAARSRIVPPGAVVGMARQLESGATAEHLRAEGFDLVVDADDVFAP